MVMVGKYTVEGLRVLHEWGYLPSLSVFIPCSCFLNSTISDDIYDGYNLVKYELDKDYGIVIHISEFDTRVTYADIVKLLQSINTNTVDNKVTSLGVMNEIYEIVLLDYTDRDIALFHNSGDNTAYIIMKPPHTQVGDVLIPCKSNISAPTYSEFKLDGGVITFKDDKGIKHTLDYYISTALVKGLAAEYHELNILIRDLEIDYLMRQIAGAKSFCNIGDMVVTESIKCTRGNTTQYVTSKGTIETFVVAPNILNNYLETSLIGQGNEVHIKNNTRIQGNILKIYVITPHSIEIVKGQIKIWMTCEITLNNSCKLYGKLPLEYCIPTLFSNTNAITSGNYLEYCKSSVSEEEYYINVTTSTGSVRIQKSILNHLNSDFTWEEVFSVVPKYAELYLYVFNKSIYSDTLNRSILGDSYDTI